MRGLASLTVKHTGRLINRRMPFWEPPTPSLADVKGDQAAISSQLNCWIAGPVIVTLRYLGGQHAKRQSEHERGDDDYAFGHHESPLHGSHSMPKAVIQQLSVMAVTDLAK